jgi:hypothetical protein
MDRDTHLRKLLGEVFESAQDGLRDELSSKEYERRKQDFVFHMTDYVGDMARFAAIVARPEEWESEAATTFLIGYLYHVIPHLNAAGRLLLDHIPDPFADQAESKVSFKAGGA